MHSTVYTVYLLQLYLIYGRAARVAPAKVPGPRSGQRLFRLRVHVGDPSERSVLAVDKSLGSGVIQEMLRKLSGGLRRPSL